MKVRLAPAFLASTMAVLALLAPRAEADRNHQLVLNHSIAGVALGETLARIHGELGRPDGHKYFQSEISGTVRVDYYEKLSVSTIGKVVTSVTSSRRSARTESGIGVGTTKRRLNRRFPNMSCFGAICRVSRYPPSEQIGRPVTDFRVRKSRVRSVTVGTVID